MARTEWLSSERHLCLFWGSISLAVIAGHARGDQILPRILSTPALWIHMIDS